MPGKGYQPLTMRHRDQNLASSTARQPQQPVDSQTILKAINRKDVALQSVCRQLARQHRLTPPIASKILKYGLRQNAYRRVD